MAFEGLTEKISSAFKHLRSKGRLTESDIKEAMREIRMALLEADVNFKVAKDFIKAVTEKATDAEILESLSPSQQVIKIVNEELVALLGGQTTRLTISPNPPTIVMMAGLQGAGKTTNCAKLAALLRKQQQRRPLLVACDVYRPAAIEQLKVVGKQLNITVFDEGQGDPVEIAKHGIDFARKNGYDLVFLDTAGRLHIDEKLMDELKNIKATVKPTEIILVVDAMTGQDAVTVAQTFDEALGIDGVLMSKMDGDARGGAALSVKAVTGKPIKFIGTGEKLGDIEPFHPDRMASRILGMGDVLTLIEKAQESFDQHQDSRGSTQTGKKGHRVLAQQDGNHHHASHKEHQYLENTAESMEILLSRRASLLRILQSFERPDKDQSRTHRHHHDINARSPLQYLLEYRILQINQWHERPYHHSRNGNGSIITSVKI